MWRWTVNERGKGAWSLWREKIDRESVKESSPWREQPWQAQEQPNFTHRGRNCCAAYKPFTTHLNFSIGCLNRNTFFPEKLWLITNLMLMYYKKFSLPSVPAAFFALVFCCGTASHACSFFTSRHIFFPWYVSQTIILKTIFEKKDLKVSIINLGSAQEAQISYIQAHSHSPWILCEVPWVSGFISILPHPVNNMGDSFSKCPAPTSEPVSPEHASKGDAFGSAGVQGASSEAGWEIPLPEDVQLLHRLTGDKNLIGSHLLLLMFN